MKKTITKRKFITFHCHLIIVIIVISLNSCVNSKQKPEVGNIVHFGTEDTLTESTIFKLEDYKVILAADSNIYLNETCELRVWIGAEDVYTIFSKNMISDSSTIPARIGQYAKITPYAPDFEVIPVEINCIRIDPSGSDVRFSLKPKKTGVLKVSASIELFNEVGCVGPPVPKTAKTLSVSVKINKAYVFTEGAIKMAITIWDKFLSFWGLLVTLLFSTLLFIIRRKIKRKTGFDDTQ